MGNYKTVRFTKQTSSPTTTQSSSSGTYFDVTSLTVTLPNKPSGHAFVIFTVRFSIASGDAKFRIMDNAVGGADNRITGNAGFQTIVLSTVTPMTGQVVKLQALSVDAGELSIYGTTASNPSLVQSLEFP